MDKIELEKPIILELINAERKVQFLINAVQMLDDTAKDSENPTQEEIISILEKDKRERNYSDGFFTEWALKMLSDKNIYESVRHLYLTYRVRHLRIATEIALTMAKQWNVQIPS